MKTIDKKALSKMIMLIIAVAVVLIIIVAYFVFLANSSGKNNNSDNQVNVGKDNGVINREPLIINSEKNILRDKGCAPSYILILENMKFFEEPKQFTIIGRNKYENKEVCYIRDAQGKQYYITLDGEKMYSVKIENGKRTITLIPQLNN